MERIYSFNPGACTRQKYSQLNQHNKHTENNYKIQHNKTTLKKTIQYNNATEKPRMRQERESHSTDLLIPRRSSNSAVALHTQAVHCQGVLLGVFHPCLTMKGSWMHLEVAKPLVSPLTPVPQTWRALGLLRTLFQQSTKVSLVQLPELVVALIKWSGKEKSWGRNSRSS